MTTQSHKNCRSFTIFLKVTQALRIRHFKKEKKHYAYIQNTKNSNYTHISAKKYRIPWLKTPKIPYTQNPWPDLFNKMELCNNTPEFLRLLEPGQTASRLFFLLNQRNERENGKRGHFARAMYERQRGEATRSVSRCFLPSVYPRRCN